MSALESLPGEIQWQIFLYLLKPLSCYPFHGLPRNMTLYDTFNSLTIDSECRKWHPFNSLAASSQVLYQAIESYCQHLLRTYPEIIKTAVVPDGLQSPSFLQATAGRVAVKKSPSAKGTKQSKHKHLSYRKVWLSSIWRGCLFCHKGTRRRGIFDMLIWTCKACDHKHFGRAITKTDAWKKYQVKPLHLIYTSDIFGDIPALAQRKFKIGMHPIAGVAATLFLKDEVEQLSALLQQYDPEGARVKAWRVEQATLWRNLESTGFCHYVEQCPQIPMFRVLIREMDEIMPTCSFSSDAHTFENWREFYEKSAIKLREEQNRGNPVVLCRYTVGKPGLLFYDNFSNFKEIFNSLEDFNWRWKTTVIY